MRWLNSLVANKNQYKYKNLTCVHKKQRNNQNNKESKVQNNTQCFA